MNEPAGLERQAAGGPFPTSSPLTVKCRINVKSTYSGIIMEAERHNQLESRLDDYFERQSALRRYL